ncbi:MAG TPA: hypothetical protein VM124_02880 [Candidatus Limnocylindrales bacterium]|nr:hypothetical protein [Candidatus Limnocylindrales bacterium]
MDNNQSDQLSSEPKPVSSDDTSQASLTHGERVIQPLTPTPVNPEPVPTPEPPAVAISPMPADSPISNVMPQQGEVPVPNTAPVPPEAPSGSTFIAGSQLQEEKVKLPTGIFVIAGLNLLGFITGFFDTSQTGAIYTVVMFINLLLAIGLVLRYEIARRSMLWLSGLTLIIAVAGIFMLGALQQKIKQSKADYETAISRIDKNMITQTQKQQLETITATIASQEKLAGKAITLTYIKLGVATLEAVGILVYLTRPSVKGVFRTTE